MSTSLTGEKGMVSGEEEFQEDPQEEEEETEEETEDEPTMTNVQSINGIEIEIRDTANEGSKVTEQILHKKEDRQSLTKANLAELYEKATKTVH
jgi:hypothetical protein